MNVHSFNFVQYRDGENQIEPFDWVHFITYIFTKEKKSSETFLDIGWVYPLAKILFLIPKHYTAKLLRLYFFIS